MITVFYDGKCGLCAKEIGYYRRVAPNGIFDFQDITQSSEELAKAGVSLSEGLKILHVQDEAGIIHKGVDAFILIWAQLQFWKILAALVSLPLVKPVAYFLYTRFAEWRFKRLPHCRLAEKMGQ